MRTRYRSGNAHSERGHLARSAGAMAWGKLPATLRRKLTAKQAETLNISSEWHHSGAYAKETFVYYPEQVAAYWQVIDEHNISIDDLLSSCETFVIWGNEPPTEMQEKLQRRERDRAVRKVRLLAEEAAETARSAIFD